MGEKEYRSARELRSAVDRYFASICYREAVTRTVTVTEDREFIKNGERVVMQVPALDKYGHVQTAQEPVLHGKKPMMREVWTRPPCMPELLEALRISRETWQAMREDKELGAVCARAEGRIEIYNIQRLDSSNANGAKFHLERKFGWSEKDDAGAAVALKMPEGSGEWAK